MNKLSIEKRTETRTVVAKENLVGKLKEAMFTYMENGQKCLNQRASEGKKNKSKQFNRLPSLSDQSVQALAKDEERSLLPLQPVSLTIATSIKVFYSSFDKTSMSDSKRLSLQQQSVSVCVPQAWCPRPRCAYQPWSR